jgi:hypothetical protein
MGHEPRFGELIGRQTHVDGRLVEVLDYLPDRQILVLRACEVVTAIQTTAYGAPRRFAPLTLEIPIMSESVEDFHPVVRRLVDQLDAHAFERFLGSV